MAFKLENNPLENNALFSPAPQDAPKPAQKKPKAKAKAEAKPAAEKPQKRAEYAGGYQRATFIVREDLLKKLKDYAYTERREIKDVVNEILAEALEKVEAEYRKDGRKMMEKE